MVIAERSDGISDLVLRFSEFLPPFGSKGGFARNGEEPGSLNRPFWSGATNSGVAAPVGTLKP